MVFVLLGGVLGSRAVPCVPALADGPSGGFWKGCRMCLCLLGLTPILGSLLREFSGLRACSISPSHYLALRWFRSYVGRWFLLCGFSRVSCVDTDCCFCSPFLGAVCGDTGVCSSLTSWRVQGLGWFCLWALDLVELLCLGGCMPRCCFRFVFDSTGSAGVMFGLTLVVGRGASSPAGSECELQKSVAVVAGLREPTCGVAFTSAGLWSAELVEVGIFARAKQMLVCRVTPLVECYDTCLWLLSALCWLVVNSSEVLPEFFSVGSGGIVWLVAIASPSKLRVEVCCYCVGRCVLVGFPERCLGGSGGGSPRTCLRSHFVDSGKGSSQECSVFVLGYRCVAPVAYCVPSSSAFRGLLEVVVLAHGNWYRVAHCGDLRGEGRDVSIVPFRAMLVSSSFRCVFCLCLSYALEALVAVWCVALSVCVVSCGESSLLALVVRSLVQLRCILPGYWCLWWSPVLVLEWFVFVSFGALVALSVVRQVLAAACGRVFSLAWERVRPVGIPSFGLGPFEVNVLSSTSTVVSIPVQFADVLGCLALPTSDVFPDFASTHYACGAFGLVFLWLHSRCVSLSDHEDDLGEIESSGADGHCPACHGEVPSFGFTFDALLAVVSPWWQAGQSHLSGCRGVPEGCVLVAVWAAIALRLLKRRPALSRLGGRRLKALASTPFPLLWLFLLSLLSEEGILFPLSSSDGWSLAERRRLVAELEWCLVVFVATLGCSIPAVCLPTDVATAAHTSRHQRRRRFGQVRPYRGMVIRRDKSRVMTRFLVVTHFPVTTGRLSRLPYLSRWYRDRLGGRDSTGLALSVSVASLA
ncbi:hypothetical protein Taro_034482 [Colocasia esculenta]|uniref:Uncharacterized protein n=1 Tax=Colocasia esculenta TaxID=4460 RepID=A0A843VWI4_COLES|nr:hypothetical protein [Colocasia esculenta]